MNLKQRKILKILNNNVGLRYSELYKYFREEDKFPYHLKYLIKNKYILKEKDKYFLTPSGAAYAVNWIDSDFNEMVNKVPRIVLVCKYKDKFLVKKYSHNIFTINSFYGLPGIKVQYGTINLNEIIIQKLENKFLIKGDHTYRCAQNYLLINSNKEVILDFLYLVFDVNVKEIIDIPVGFKWSDINEIKELRKISIILDDFVINDLKEPFSERIMYI